MSTYKLGDLVLLLCKFIETRWLNSKLDYRYLGPFRVIEIVGNNAVHLELGKDYPKLHPVFNVLSSLVIIHQHKLNVEGQLWEFVTHIIHQVR